jgi:hypothetical protein
MQEDGQTIRRKHAPAAGKRQIHARISRSESARHALPCVYPLRTNFAHASPLAYCCPYACNQRMCHIACVVAQVETQPKWEHGRMVNTEGRERKWHRFIPWYYHSICLYRLRENIKRGKTPGLQHEIWTETSRIEISRVRTKQHRRFVKPLTYVSYFIWYTQNISLTVCNQLQPFKWSSVFKIDGIISL